MHISITITGYNSWAIFFVYASNTSKLFYLDLYLMVNINRAFVIYICGLKKLCDSLKKADAHYSYFPLTTFLKNLQSTFVQWILKNTV